MPFITKQFSSEVFIDLSRDSKRPRISGEACLTLRQQSDSLLVDWGHPTTNTTVNLLLTPSLNGFRISVQSWPNTEGSRRGECRVVIDEEGRMSVEER